MEGDLSTHPPAKAIPIPLIDSSIATHVTSCTAATYEIGAKLSPRSAHLLRLPDRCDASDAWSVNLTQHRISAVVGWPVGAREPLPPPVALDAVRKGRSGLAG